MYPNLEAEMARKGLTGGDIAAGMNIAQSTFSAKLNKIDRLKLKECVEIIDKFFPGMKIDYLFKWENSTQGVKRNEQKKKAPRRRAGG